MKIIFIFSFIIIFNNNEIFSYIVFPLNTLPKDNYVFSKDKSENSIIKKFFYSDIYTTFFIGSSHQKIPIFLSVSKNIFQITSSLSSKSSSLDEPEIYQILPLYENNNIFFNEEESNTFKKNEEIIFQNKKTGFGNDTVLLYNNLNLKHSLEFTMNFELLFQFQKENIPGEMGLSFPNNNENNYNLIKKFNILTQLKENNLIDNYNWFLIYDKWNSTNGKLIIGSQPHNLFPKKFSQKNLILTKSILDSSTGHYWKLKFKTISLDRVNLKNLTTELLFDSEVIIAPNEVDTLLLKNFLQEQLNHKNCFEHYYYLKSHYVTTLKYYYCNKNIQNEILEKMPNIKLYSKEFDYTFEINKEDILIVEENYIFFKILLFIEDYNIWLLGKPFTLKYQFVFNPDSKQIGFYNPDYSYEKKRIWKSKNFRLILIIVILCLIFTILGIIIGKKIYGLKRKQKANELIDDFEYIPERKNIINDINKNGNFSISNSNYKTIEMNSNLY